jgi:small subunit ribosomal protein S13
MAEKEKYVEKEKVEKPEEKKADLHEYRLIRILAKDLAENRKVHSGLTSIKGISWSFSNALCKKLKLSKDKKIGDLSKDEIAQIENFVKEADVPAFLKNRRKDLDTGEDKHFHGSDLSIRTEFDIKRLKKIKSYKGQRHNAGLPVRGQRTKSNFRRNRKKSGAVGVNKKGVNR